MSTAEIPKHDGRPQRPVLSTSQEDYLKQIFLLGDGVESVSTAVVIGDVIEERADRGARTAMTSNLPPVAPAGEPGHAGILGRYGDRFVSRLRGGGLNDKGRAKWVRVVAALFITKRILFQASMGVTETGTILGTISQAQSEDDHQQGVKTKKATGLKPGRLLLER